MNGYNGLKRKTLAALADGRAVDVPHLASRVGYYPVRGYYSYLANLRRWGLLERSRGWAGRILYRISDRGRARLAWFRGQGRARTG